jgi:hypothetical protein
MSSIHGKNIVFITHVRGLSFGTHWYTLIALQYAAQQSTTCCDIFFIFSNSVSQRGLALTKAKTELSEENLV